MALPKLYAIYDADGTLLGELSYLKDKCLGKAECALCDLSHGWNPLGKASWRQRQGLAASLEWVHRDEAPSHVLSAVSDHLPCIAIDRAGARSAAAGPLADLATARGVHLAAVNATICETVVIAAICDVFTRPLSSARARVN